MGKNWQVEYETLFLYIGAPAWALVNGTWSSLAMLATYLPEGYSISAYLLCALTLGNMLPFYLGTKTYMYSRHDIAKLMTIIQLIGLLSGISLALFWDTTFEIFGTQYSLVLYFLFFCIGACSASTSLTHYTYVSSFPPLSTTYLSTGMGAGSMFAGVLALIQNNLLPTKFWLSLNFTIVALLYIPSIIAVWRIEEGWEKQEALKRRQNDDIDRKGVAHESSSSHSSESKDEGGFASGQEFEEWTVVRNNVWLLLCVGIASALGHGLIPCVISSLSGRFSLNNETLSFATGEAAVCDPIFRFYTAYFRFTSRWSIYKATAALVLIAVAIVVLLELPDSLTIYSTPLGGVVAVTLNVSFVCLFVFTNTSSFLYLKEKVPPRLVGYAYKWNGMFVQYGAAFGSLISLILFLLKIL